jgi:SAM-dependent methyltransferase
VRLQNGDKKPIISTAMNKAAHLKYHSKLFPGSSHSWAVERLSTLSPTASVLDIGPGSGVIGAKLREQGVSQCSAVEIDAATREHLAPIYSTIVGDLNEIPDKEFDVVLLLDVLEHIAEPEAFLRRAVLKLKEGGRLLVTVPNIAHWSVRIPLLFGYFEYTDRGLLDRTHLQFFTKDRALRLKNVHHELTLVVRSASIPPVEFVLPELVTGTSVFRLLSAAHLKIAQLLPGLFGYQHLLEFRLGD